MKRNNWIILTSLFLILAIGGLYFAGAAKSQPAAITGDDNAPQEVQSPTDTLFSYQGQLLNAAGDPITQVDMPMTFSLYDQATGGAACWTENQTVAVEDGRFHVNIGVITPIPDTCLENDTYLELNIDGETLSPRELLTSVAHAVSAQNVPNGAKIGTAVVGEHITFESKNNSGRIIGPDNGILHLAADPSPLASDMWFRGGWIWLQSIDGTGSPGSVRVHIAKDTILDNAPFFDVVRIQDDATSSTLLSVDENGNLSANGNLSVESQIKFGEEQILRMDSSRQLHLLPWGGSGYRFDSVCIGCGQSADLTVNGNMTLNGTCTASIAGNEVASADESCTGGSLTTGAVIEANLQTPEEMRSDNIERFDLGDLLCWATNVERLEKCDTADDKLVMAVANRSGKPIVMGAEPVKVIGPVQAGDILVASDTPGYAMVNNNPAPGTVIGQALEDFDGESGLIKAMIRKW